MLQAAACCMLLHVLQAAFAHLQSLLNCVFRSLPAATVAGSAQAGRGEGGLGSMTGPQGLWAWQGQVLLLLGGWGILMNWRKGKGKMQRAGLCAFICLHCH